MNCLEDLGIKKLVNKTRTKINLLEHIPEPHEHHNGKNTIVFKDGIKNILKEVLMKQDFSEDAVKLAKAAMVVRNDVFSHKCFKFTSSFHLALNNLFPLYSMALT